MKKIISFALNIINNIYLKNIYKYKNNCRFIGKVNINKHSSFEGFNSIGKENMLLGTKFGFGSYTGNNVNLYKVKVGRFCSIASNVSNLKGRHPTKKFVSTHPSFFSTGKAAGFTFSTKQKFEEIEYIDDKNEFINIIGNDVWIGENVVLMDGIYIGDGAIVGACSLVTKNIEPYTINIGIPAKPIKRRFTDEQIEFLLSFKWWNKNFDWIRSNFDIFENIDSFMEEVKTKNLDNE